MDTQSKFTEALENLAEDRNLAELLDEQPDVALAHSLEDGGGESLR